MNPAPNATPTPCDELYRRIRITAGARFNAYRRLAWHDHLTQWSIGLASLGLIVIPLLEGVGATTGMSSGLLTAVQIILAIFVLVFSLLLSRNNHAVRADRMHRCGMELKKLLRDLESSRRRDVDDATYARLTESYDRILVQYENHATSDYERYLLYCRDEYYPGKGWWRLLWPTIKVRLAFALEFVPYLALIAVMTVAFVLMLGNPQSS